MRPKQVGLLARWFHNRGFGLAVAGECEEKRTTAARWRSSTGGKYKPVKGPEADKYRTCVSDRSPNAAIRLGQRVRVALRRQDMSVVNVVAWHGCHGEGDFARQMEALEGIADAGSAVIMSDVNRRASESQSSRAGPLNNGDRRWRDFVGWRDDGVPDPTGGGRLGGRR